MKHPEIEFFKVYLTQQKDNNPNRCTVSVCCELIVFKPISLLSCLVSLKKTKYIIMKCWII